MRIRARVQSSGRAGKIPAMRAPRSWDIFCRVVDNYGDAAVCWRLARGLAAASGAGRRTRLWIDDLSVLHKLLPGIAPGKESQSAAGVEICHWTAEAEFGEPAEVAVDAFGCGIPEDYAEAMAAPSRRRPRSLAIILEYLSAEPWVARHHGLPSPHPRLPLARFFFFPGFGEGTGGLLREPGLSARREDFLARPQAREALWREAGFAPPAAEATLVTLFGYENPALGALLEAWAAGGRPVVAAVPESRLAAGVAACLGAGSPARGEAARRGALEVRFLPFLAQDRYDELLWGADWNFVRGEDSFVRAQWAERPFVWHIYPQAEHAHLAKLEAFLTAYCKGLAPVLARPLRALWRGWNASGEAPERAVSSAWAGLSALTPGQLAALRLHARDWAVKAARSGDLAENLADFCAKRLK